MCQPSAPKIPAPRRIPPPPPPPDLSKLQIAPAPAAGSTSRPKGMAALRRDLTIPTGGSVGSGLNIPV